MGQRGTGQDSIMLLRTAHNLKHMSYLFWGFLCNIFRVQRTVITKIMESETADKGDVCEETDGGVLREGLQLWIMAFTLGKTEKKNTGSSEKVTGSMDWKT